MCVHFDIHLIVSISSGPVRINRVCMKTSALEAFKKLMYIQTHSAGFIFIEVMEKSVWKSVCVCVLRLAAPDDLGAGGEFEVRSVCRTSLIAFRVPSPVSRLRSLPYFLYLIPLSWFHSPVLPEDHSFLSSRGQRSLQNHAIVKIQSEEKICHSAGDVIFSALWFLLFNH